MQRVPETDPEHPSRNEIFELAFDEAFGARAVFENRCPQGLVGSSPTPSARSDLQRCDSSLLHKERVVTRLTSFWQPGSRRILGVLD
jgi:hypothetical protein